MQKGKQKPTVHVKLRSISTGHTGERTLDQLGKLEEVPTEIREMQYLYANRSERVFMDTESYEQFPLGEDVQDCGATLPMTSAGLSHSSERQMNFRADGGRIYIGDSRGYILNSGEGIIDVPGVYR